MMLKEALGDGQEAYREKHFIDKHFQYNFIEKIVLKFCLPKGRLLNIGNFRQMKNFGLMCQIILLKMNILFKILT